MAAAWIVDLNGPGRANFAFWLHLAGAAAFWGGLTLRETSSEMLAFVYCLINAGLIFFAVFIDRRIYAIFGALGIATYLGHEQTLDPQRAAFKAASEPRPSS
jgi:hypothetical protein